MASIPWPLGCGAGLEVELTSGDFSPIKAMVEYSDSERVSVACFEVNGLRDNEMKSASEP